MANVEMTVKVCVEITHVGIDVTVIKPTTYQQQDCAENKQCPTDDGRCPVQYLNPS